MDQLEYKQVQFDTSSAVAEKPRDASCHWIFCYFTQCHSRSFEWRV